MNTVTISSKYQVIIPRIIREEFNIIPGEKFKIFSDENRIELVPIKSIKDVKGFLKGIKTDIKREADRL